MPKEFTDIEQGRGSKVIMKGPIEAYHRDMHRFIKAMLMMSESGKTAAKQILGRDFLRACERGNPETLKTFFDAGMDVNYQDPRTGQTALHVTGAAQAHMAVHALLATGECDFLIRDNKGRLSSEMAYLYGNDPELAELLGNKEREQAEAQGIKLTRRPPPQPEP